MSAARSSSSRVSTAFFSADCGRLKNWTQMQVSTRTRPIRLGSFEGAPVVVHRDLPGELLQAHPAGVSAVLLKGAAECTRHIADPCKVAEVLYLVVVKVDCRCHAQ